MILRVCVVIPTYNNPETIGAVVLDVLRSTPFPILLVDDGSDNPAESMLYAWEVRQAMEQGRLRLHRFESNQGKGMGLRFAIHDLAARGFTHMLTMDGDGQHQASQITCLIEQAKDHPWDLIIGHRRLHGDSVPGISKFGRRFSNFWVRYQTGLAVRDSQSGFRLYPLFPLQNYQFFTRRYDFEIEVLIRLIWHHVGVREVDIDVHYPEGEARVSHFHKFWDNARISILNTVLVIVSLLRSHKQPREVAWATAIGVFIGATPFYGLHTLIVAGAAFLLRMNAVAMFLGSQISIPPLAPLLVLGSVYVGQKWMGIDLGSGPIPHFQQWLAGSLILGAALGATIGTITYFAMRLAKSRPRQNWTGKTRGGRLGNGFLRLVLKLLGIRAGYFCLKFIVPYFYIFAPNARRGLQEYYQVSRPGLSWFRRQWLVLAHLYRFGQVLMDRVYQGFHRDLCFKARSNGMNFILDESKSGKGLILLGAHMGGWDLASILVRDHGLQDEVYRIEYRAEGLTYHNVKEDLDPTREKLVSSGPKQDAIFTIHQALRDGRTIGLMGDRPIGHRFELIPFLGRLAPFDVTAFRLAAATGTPLLFTYGLKAADGNYDFYARPARRYTYAPGLAREFQLYAWVEQYVRDLEERVKVYPDQWFNFYPFWSSLPVPPEGQTGSGQNQLLEDLPLPTDMSAGWEVQP
ncbi:MAG: DUF2062 domain-containing protein [Bdellovibrionales bacterium]